MRWVEVSSILVSLPNLSKPLDVLLLLRGDLREKDLFESIKDSKGSHRLHL
jgi:hypothetical protein